MFNKSLTAFGEGYTIGKEEQKIEPLHVQQYKRAYKEGNVIPE